MANGQGAGDPVTERRKAFLAYARKIASDGAHYLWGAYGYCRLARVVLDPDNLGDTTFCAAVTTVDGKDYVCAGRFEYPGLDARPGFPPQSGRPPVHAPHPGPVLIPSTDQNLRNFIDLYRRNPNAQIGWDSRLTPRKITGNVTWYGHKVEDKTKPAKDGKPQMMDMPLDNVLAWGEGCEATLHFDCNGLIRYVIKQVCGIELRVNADLNVLEAKKNSVNQPVAEVVPPSTPTSPQYVLPGDILIYPGHSAIVIADTPQPQPYDPKTHYRVVQAESGTLGVTDAHTHPQTSTKCLRLTPSTLLGHA